MTMTDVFVILLFLCSGIYAAVTLLERRLVALQASIDRLNEAATRLALSRQAGTDADPPTDPDRARVQTDKG